MGIVLDKVKSSFVARGRSSIAGLGRKFRYFDDNGDRKVEKEELYWGLKDQGVNISKKESHILLEYLDTNQDGNVNFDEFLIAIRGIPNDFRM